MTTKDTNQCARSRWMLGYLMLTAMVCGALVMVVEVLGSRVIGPFFGVSLFIWTSLISVTLISLSLGYAIGGYLADRRATAEFLFGIILLAGIAVIIIPYVKSPVLQFCVPFGLRIGSFASTAILFGPSLILLGCVSPYLIKITAKELKNIGQIVGGFYALSTVGSVIGTVVTGFVLIAYMGVNSIFHLVGTLLVILALGYFVVFKRIWWTATLVLIPVVMMAYTTDTMPDVVMNNGTRVSLVASHDSYYGNLKVVDYRYQDVHTREMMIDGLIQGGVDRNTGESIYTYPYFMAYLPFALADKIQSCLVIGLGAGIVPKWYEQRGVRTDVVDINPAVFDFARIYFGVTVSGDEIQEDARYFLQYSDKTYDVVVLDVFNGDTTPGHLLSLEALRLLEKRLTRQGMLTINLAGSLYKNTYMTASVVRTLKTIFDQVDIFPTADPEKTGGKLNLVILAYNGSERTLDFDQAPDFKISSFARQDVFNNIGRRFYFPENTPSIILMDDYNPIDFFDAELKENVRKNILETTEWDILTYSG